MHLVWTKRAVFDLHRVREHIRSDNPAAAERTGARIETTVRHLARHPEMGRAGEVPGTRELVITGFPYIVVYRVRGEAVQILRVFHGKQAWPSTS